MKWDTKTLGDVCEFRGGGTPSKAVERYWRGNIPWVSPKDMKSEMIVDSIDHVSQEAICNSSTSLVPKGSVLMVVRSGILARTVPIALAGRDLTINQDIKALCPKAPIDARFLYHFLNSKMGHLLSTVSRGATVHRLMTEQLRSLKIAMPPISEQHRIVDILDEAFVSIDTLRRNTSANVQNVRALHESHVHSVLSRREDGWLEKTIGECFKVRSGDFLPAKSMNESGRIDVYGGNGITGKHDQKNLSGENIVIGRVGAKCGNVRHVVGDLWLTDNAFFISEFMQKFDLAFLARLLELKDLRSTANQAAQPVISYTTIKDVVLQFPVSERKQRAISQALDEIEADTEPLEALYRQKLVALDALKQSLLHAAFRGKL